MQTLLQHLFNLKKNSFFFAMEKTDTQRGRERDSRDVIPEALYINVKFNQYKMAAAVGYYQYVS